MNSAEIRETYLSFFESKGHKRVPSASLVPSAHDPSVLLTTAGMQPFKPYFLGQETPPARRLTSCQKCFRTTDIEQVGSTARHLTFFEMLGNFSFGDYFAEDAIAFGWELSTDGFGFDPERIWVTVFAGDEELGLGPDEQAIGYWRALGVPDERIVRLPRSENFWQAGPTGPSGPCSEMYYDRGEAFGGGDERPGDDGERYLEYWNHVFMTYDLHEDGSLTELPSKNIDTGLGVERMAAIQQDAPSVYEADPFLPLVELAEQLSGRRRDADDATTRAVRILADHTRGMTFLIADGVVPSNEDRGYILRRVMRRAIQQGRVLELDSPYLERFAERVIEAMSPVYPELGRERETILRWVRDEEESFGRTLDRGIELLGQLVTEAKERETSWIDAAEAFKLHDTYGFPYDLTKELLAEQGLAVDDQGFEELMEEQRQRARVGSATAHGAEDRHATVIGFAASAPPTRFVGYETLRASTSVAAAAGDSAEGDARKGQRQLVKLEDSPFYAEGGGQVADSGVLRVNGVEARVLDVYRVGDDQALSVELASGEIEPGAVVDAEVERRSRHATMRNHTATHLLHAALRERLGTHVRQAGSAVRPDKLRFDFTHGAALDPTDVSAIEERVNGWIGDSLPVRAIQMDRSEAERLGAMALFGEKYGEWVRVVEVEEVSRELCGGTHVANTAEIGIFALVSEGSSAANVRRVEALTGPAAIDYFRQRAAAHDEAGTLLGSPDDPAAGARRAAERLAELERQARKAGAAGAAELAEGLAAKATDASGIAVLAEATDLADQRELLALANRVGAGLGPSAVVLGGASDGRVGIVALFSPEAVERGLSAVDVVRKAAELVGGGGGGRENAAQAGGKDPSRLGEALELARGMIEDELAA
ncbi:MAG: alanyl-tRNA synthetase [Solirubrobacterales bacterium]|jgi:alanyl-tRNA synthetase|nr:alanyl-tRNA synthetase [Solirubrobacterales bacterium]